MPFKLLFKEKLLEKQVKDNRLITLADAAQEIGITRPSAYRYARETPKQIDLEALEKMCDYFNCTTNDLLERVK